MKAHIQQILTQLSAPDVQHQLKIVQQELVPYINQLMDTNFMNFVQTLYELDIDEHKIIEITQQQAMHAGQIADLIIAREFQKIESRKKYKQIVMDTDKDLLL